MVQEGARSMAWTSQRNTNRANAVRINARVQTLDALPPVGRLPGFGLLTECLNRSAHYFPGSCDRIALILT
jgi:hypothetical protein